MCVSSLSERHNWLRVVPARAGVAECASGLSGKRSCNMHCAPAASTPKARSQQGEPRPQGGGLPEAQRARGVGEGAPFAESTCFRGAMCTSRTYVHNQTRQRCTTSAANQPPTVCFLRAQHARPGQSSAPRNTQPDSVASTLGLPCPTNKPRKAVQGRTSCRIPTAHASGGRALAPLRPPPPCLLQQQASEPAGA